MTHVVVVDNHDSFVHTLIGYLHELGASTSMVEADAVDDIDALLRVAGATDADEIAVDGVLISPGPGAPADAGASVDVVRAAARADVPVLGVCLGHQAIALAFGARVAAAPELMHGMTSDVEHDGSWLFAGMRHPFVAGRYHSLAVDPASLSAELAVTATTASGTVMAIAHRTARIVGVQFHPESVLTEGGYRLLGNWLEHIGLDGAAARGAHLHPHRSGE